MKPRHWFARLVISAWAGQIAVITLAVPESLAARGLVYAGIPGYFLVVSLLWIVGIGLVDNFVNDMLPERFQLSIKNYRHIGFMAMSIALLLLGAATAITAKTAIVLISYLFPVVFAVAVTWLDIFDRRPGARA